MSAHIAKHNFRISSRNHLIRNSFVIIFECRKCPMVVVVNRSLLRAASTQFAPLRVDWLGWRDMFCDNTGDPGLEGRPYFRYVVAHTAPKSFDDVLPRGGRFYN